jgi:hypothetical protein
MHFRHFFLVIPKHFGMTSMFSRPSACSQRYRILTYPVKRKKRESVFTKKRVFIRLQSLGTHLQSWLDVRSTPKAPAGPD